MSKVVYLLGAGASFGTRENGIGSPVVSGLPIVCEIEGELESMANLLVSLPLNDKSQILPFVQMGLQAYQIFCIHKNG